MLDNETKKNIVTAQIKQVEAQQYRTELQLISSQAAGDPIGTQEAIKTNIAKFDKIIEALTAELNTLE